MPVYSMTGYALHSGALPPGADSGPGQTWTIELRSINSRYLDIHLRLADALRPFEGALRERVTQVCKRGKIELRISPATDPQSEVALPSAAWLQHLHMVQYHVQSHLREASALTVADVLRLHANQSTTFSPVPDQALLALCDAALQKLQHSRAQEGAQLALGMQERLTRIAALTRDAAQHSTTASAQQQEKFWQRWQQALTLTQKVNSQNLTNQADRHGLNANTLAHISPEALQERALSELASFAVRVDIAEEIERLHVHVQSLQKLLETGGEIGKKAEFLIQELQREANTLGAKAPVLALGQIALELKVLIEQLREQVQNIA